jgi:hypothetical protein
MRQYLQCPTSVTLSFPQIKGDEYTFIFNGVTDNMDGTFTWCYTVMVTLQPGSGRGLSSAIFELCPELTAGDISNVMVDGLPVSFEFGDIKIFPPAPTPSLFGIKVELGIDTGESKQFCFTLDKKLTPLPGELVIKVGSGPPSPDTVLIAENAICAPLCPAVTGRGFKLKGKNLQLK